MTQESIPYERVLIEALNQNWLHIRHIEHERQQFTYVYALLISAILTLLAKPIDRLQIDYLYLILLLLFLVLLSFFGVLWTAKAHLEIHNHVSSIERIKIRLDLESYMATPIEFKGMVGKITKIGKLFRIFYIIMTSAWLTALFSLVSHHICVPISVLCFFLFVFCILFCLFYLNLRIDEKDEKEIEGKIKKLEGRVVELEEHAEESEEVK